MSCGRRLPFGRGSAASWCAWCARAYVVVVFLSSLGLASPEPIELDAIASPNADPESRVLLAQVYSLLQTLRRTSASLGTLRYVDQHRLEVVAQLVECSLATAKRRILRAQRFLSEHFVPAFAEGE